MLFSPVLPLLRAKHCHFLLPPSSWCHSLFFNSFHTFPLCPFFLFPCILSPLSLVCHGGSWRRSRATQVSGKQFKVQTSDLHVFGLFLECWFLLFWLCWLCSLADSGFEGEHPLWGMQEEGQEGAAQHRRYVLFGFSKPSSNLFLWIRFEQLEKQK